MVDERRDISLWTVSVLHLGEIVLIRKGFGEGAFVSWAFDAHSFDVVGWGQETIP